MRLRTKHASELDNPSRWHLNLRPYLDVAAIQQRIDSIIGVNKDGKSLIRLIWGQNVVQRAFNEITPRYWTRRQKASPGYCYWTVPRWIFERRIEPEQYAASWEASRYNMRDEKGVPIDRGPAPSEYYLFAHACAEHESDDGSGWPACCNRAFYSDTKWGSPRSRCWGTYRPPNEDDIQLIARAMREMEAAKHVDPYRPLSSAELAEAETTANMQAERAAEQIEAYEQEMVRDYVKSFGWMLTEDDPGVLSHGRYHDLGANSKIIHRKVVSGRNLPLDMIQHLEAIKEGKERPQHS